MKEQTISAWKKSSGISDSTKTLEAEAAVNINIEKVIIRTSTIKYRNLDVLHTELHTSCKLPTINSTSDNTKITDNDTDLLQYLYLLRLKHNNRYTNICKIGIAADVDSRIKALNKEWGKIGVEFELITRSKESRPDMLSIEKALHTLYDSHMKLKYTPKNQFDGYTELFIYDESMIRLVEGGINEQ